MIRRLIPYMHASSIFEIDVSLYKKLGIKYIFTDLDNTLDSYKSKLPSPRVLSLKEKLNAEGISIIITSNNTNKRVKMYSKALGVPYFSSLCKPFSSRLSKKIVEMKINKEEILLFGDQVVTDIGCANGCNIKSCLTDKIVKEDQPTTRFNRLFDTPLRKSLAKKGLLKDWREF